MPRIDADRFSQSFDDAILDQDFDDWQAEGRFDADGDLDDDLVDVVGDSHFLLRELDFSGDFDSL